MHKDTSCYFESNRSVSFFLVSFVVCLHTALVLLLLCGEFQRARAENSQSVIIHVVKRGNTLSEIASRYQVSVEKLRFWNNLHNDKILRRQRLKLWPSCLPQWYVVRSGDTLSEIAMHFRISTSALRRLNDISRGRIYPGQKLRLRQNPSVVEDSEFYVVRKGDTLWDISESYGLAVDVVKELNNLKSDTIIPAMRLKIPKPLGDRPHGQEQFEYVVRAGDNLSAIAHRFDVDLNFLRHMNHLKGARIYPGQKLQLLPSSLDETVHVVRVGETLSSIALKYDIKLASLSEINGIEGGQIFVGQKLCLNDSRPATHMVERGDALWEVARAYGMSVKQLKRLNELTSDRIYPGQMLKVGTKQAEHSETYTVKKGDYLAEIARLHQMSVSELKKANNLRSSLIYPEEKLKVKPMLGMGRGWTKIREINWGELISSLGDISEIQGGTGPYYHSSPRAAKQRHAEYFEAPLNSPLRTYRRAQKLWRAFEREVTRLGRLSAALSGWYFVLDPGHGGMDPGAVVESLDGNGNKIYIVEDEYVYDIALRVYVLLRLHGAEVTMTLLSPNHLIRHSDPPTHTFVNQKNEVYNSYRCNKHNSRKDWPNGGRNGNLASRVYIARNAFKNTPKNRRMFLSFHADIDPEAPEASLVLYYKNRDGRQEDLTSKRFAQTLLPALGAGAHIRGRYLRVLRNNPAAIKVLFELRNLAYSDHAWALRFEQLRHRDAEKVVRGVLGYVSNRRKGQTVVSRRMPG